jgi:alcohol dehydrogenase class IV
MAGIAFSNGPALGLVHAVGHPLSARLRAAHGQTLSTMLPHVMRFNLEAAEDRYARIGLAMGVAAATGTPTGEAALATIAAVEDLSRTVGTARTITELGGGPDMIASPADDALRDLVILTTVRHPTRAQVEELYRLAL